MMADIWRTIERWRVRGVLAPDVAGDLRKAGLRVPHNTWLCVAEAMATYARLRNI